MEARVCPVCGTPWTPAAAVCGKCGAAEGATAPPVVPPPVAPPPIVPAPPAAVDAAVPAPPLGALVEGEGLAPVPVTTLRGRLAQRGLSTRVLAALGGGVALLLVLVAGAFLLLGGGGPHQLPTDLVNKMAARDATASELLVSSTDLPGLATQMGLVGIPGSVRINVENLQVVDAGPSTGPSAAPSSADAPEAFTVTYTLKAVGPNGELASVDQTLNAKVQKDANGKRLLMALTVSPPLKFDLAAYFGTAGASEADANKLADDLRAGTAWIPSLTVKVTPINSDVRLPDIETEVPGHLTTYRFTTTPAVIGAKTTWHIELKRALVSLSDVSAASATTKEPVAARVNVGTIQPADAIASATRIEQQFEDAAKSGNVAGANALFVAGGPDVTASGLSVMRSAVHSYGGTASEGKNGPEVTQDGFVFAMSPDGTWKIDSTRSHLVRMSLNGNGGYKAIVGTLRDPVSGKVTCEIHIRISLARVEWYTDNDSPSAVFSFLSSGTCVMDDEIMSAVVGWKGNSGTTLASGCLGSDPSAKQPVLRYLQLPADTPYASHPIWIKVTEYGSPDAKYPGTLTFSTV